MSHSLDIKQTIDQLKGIVGNANILTNKWSMQSYVKGWRYGEGEALAVAKPSSLLQIWNLLKLCVKKRHIVIMQAANTGLTGGSTVRI